MCVVLRRCEMRFAVVYVCFRVQEYKVVQADNRKSMLFKQSIEFNILQFMWINAKRQCKGHCYCGRQPNKTIYNVTACASAR